MNFTRITVLVLTLAVIPSAAWAATATIGASKDNTIYQNNVNNSAGGGAGIFSGTSGTGSPRRSLLAFDIAANVPAGSTITGAQLTLTLGNAPNNNNQTIGLHRLIADWGEGTAGNSTPAIGGGGNGFAAGAGDATWNSRFFGSTNWTTAGADFNAVASTSTVVSGPVESSFTWLSTSAMVGDVQSWLNNPAANFGWALINVNEEATQTVKVFYSRSATQNSTGGTLDPARRPTLVVTFVIPEPSAALLLALAGPLALVRTRR